MAMILRINKTNLISTFKYNHRQLASGMINGKKWTIYKKQRISDDLYRYVFLVTTGSIPTLTKQQTVITGDEDVRNVAEIALADNHYINWER